MSTPGSVINVCSGVRLNPSYEHTIYFESPEEQISYFTGKVKKTFPAYTYLRKSWSIKVNALMEDARTWSYLFFNNPTTKGTSKTYFYFITNIEYVNDGTVELFLELDVMQTYYFEYILLDSFVEREHPLYDTIGGNLVEEGLELGDYVLNNEVVKVTELDELCILLLTTIHPTKTTKDATVQIIGSNIGGVYSGVGITATAFAHWSELSNTLSDLDSWGKSEGIISIWMYPKALINLADGYAWDDDNVCKMIASNKTITIGSDLFRNSYIDGYQPKNNKLLSYPFNMLYASNNEGGSAVYRYEWFMSGACQFKIGGSISPEGSVKMWPLMYNRVTENYEEGLMGQKYPTCAWNQDTYKLWLAQNQAQNNLALATGIGYMVGGAVLTLTTGGVGGVAGAGTFISGLSQVSSLLAQRKDASIQPPQAKGTHSVNVNVTQDYGTFTFMQKSIDYEHARIIDDYFSMYGYKLNRIGIPSRYNRENWTYTKTVGCHIAGDLCTDDLLKIEGVYNNGITFWRDGDKIGDYSLSNQPLSNIE